MLLIALLVLEQKRVLAVAFGLRSEQENILFCAVMPPPLLLALMLSGSSLQL